ncbi:uncharacterized protein LOC126787355 [Argentina anserina]|uniref:uncharacterized protein LOC126787355 n=1 Tax=Argentina anserina TaxID=57926 RepID=UPI0021763A73|nr:uncharacterized protein LOC126787355 [Potentilla anserina]
MEAASMHTQICQSNKLKEVKEEEEDYQDSREEEEEEEEAATLPDLESPSFTRTIGKNMYNELLRFKVLASKPCRQFQVPTDFSAKYFPPGYYTIMLKNSRGEKWNVNVVPTGNVYRTVKLSSRWAEFRRDNEINYGDTCIFEVVGSKTMVVHIDRK